MQSSRSIQRMQTVQLFLNRSFILQFGCRASLCFTDQGTQEENLQGGTTAFVGQFLHPISLVQSSLDPFSACRQSNCSKTFFAILCRQFECRTSLCFTDQEIQEENLQGRTSSLGGQFVHPISLAQSSRSIQRMQTVQLFPNKIFILCWQFGCGTSLCFKDQETQEENLQGGTSSLVDQFLHPISPVQSSRSIQRMKTVQLFQKIFCYLMLAIWMCDQSMLHGKKRVDEETFGWYIQLPLKASIRTYIYDQ